MLKKTVLWPTIIALSTGMLGMGCKKTSSSTPQNAAAELSTELSPPNNNDLFGIPV